MNDVELRSVLTAGSRCQTMTNEVVILEFFLDGTISILILMTFYSYASTRNSFLARLKLCCVGSYYYL